jgi:3-hydroxyacyl-CoA dehydrogenase
MGAVTIEREGDVAVVVIDNPPVNAGSHAVRQGLMEAVAKIDADASIRGAVVIGAGTTFVAGADIREFGKPLQDPHLPAVIDAMANSPKTFVAAIHGAALGGGFELALGCDARVAAPGAIVGLPEVTLGIIPGAGGTQAVPRLVGQAAAIEMICGAKRIKAEAARDMGLVDRVAADFRAEAVAMARKAPKRRIRDLAVPAGDPAKIEEASAAALKAGRKRPHIVAAIEAVKAAAAMPYAEGVAREREIFQKLRASPEAAALRHLFFAEREAAKVPGIEGAQPRPVKKVGVLGAGTMGAGIAICFVEGGYDTILVEVDPAALERGLKRMKDHASKVTATSRLEDVADCDLVVEAVFEDMAVKKEVFAKLDAIVKAGAILATNTSYLDIDEIARATKRPGDVLGLHFFSPANVMKLLEVVRGAATAPEVLATGLAVARKIRKLPVVARVGDGFIGNRIFSNYRTQAEFMVEEGAWPEDVDAAIESFGFAMGPFAVADLAGLDIAYRNRRRLDATRDPKARYSRISDRLVESKRHGQKTGAGWYRYAEGARRGQPDPEVRPLIEAASAEKGITRRAFTAEEIRWRLLATMVNEAAQLLAEGVAQRPSDVDLVFVNGYGFPRHEGGPLFWARQQDRARLEAAIDDLERATGPGFRRGDLDRALG